MEFLAHLRKSRRQALRQRAEILLASMVYTPVYQIALIFRTDEAYVRKVIHAFNDTGFAALDPKWSGGRPRKYGPVAHQLICQTARATPSALGLPFTTWSLTKLAAYLAAHYRLPVSTETIRRVLRKADTLYDDYGRGADGMLLPYRTSCFKAVVRPQADPEPAPAEAHVPPPTDDDDALLIDFQ